MMKLFDLGAASRGNRFRERRMIQFLSILDRIELKSTPLRILDVGGEPGHWLAFSDLLVGRQFQITLLNFKQFEIDDPRFHSVVGDATDLSGFKRDEFDIIYSNSVVEHVGRWPEMKLMADGITKLSKRYFVQTPNYWFPIEPHFRFPFFHWLPEPLRLQLVMARPCGFYPRASSIDEGMKMIESAVLLTKTQLQSLFPGAQIIRERFGPFTKSLIALSLDNDVARAQLGAP
jgi:SAM-dependent methyltransferase